MQCTNRYKKKNKDKNKINWFFFSHSIKFWLSILRFHSQIIWTRTKELTKVEKILNKHIWIINQCSEFISNLENFYILLIMKKRKRECLKSVLFYCWKPYPRGICSHSLCDQLCTRRNEVPKNVKKSTERIGWKWTNEESFWIETKLSRFFDVIFDTSSFLLRLPLIGSLLARFKNSTDSRRQLLLKMVQIEWANKTVNLLLMAKTKLRWTELNDSIFEAMQIRYVNDFIPNLGILRDFPEAKFLLLSQPSAHQRENAHSNSFSKKWPEKAIGDQWVAQLLYCENWNFTCFVFIQNLEKDIGIESSRWRNKIHATTN